MFSPSSSAAFPAASAPVVLRPGTPPKLLNSVNPAQAPVSRQVASTATTKMKDPSGNTVDLAAASELVGSRRSSTSEDSVIRAAQELLSLSSSRRETINGGNLAAESTAMKSAPVQRKAAELASSEEPSSKRTPPSAATQLLPQRF